MERIISFQGITLLTVVEAIAATKYLPHYLPNHHALLSSFILLFSINIVLYGFYLGLIYPYFIDPLRHFPTAEDHSMFFYGYRYATTSPPGSQFITWMRSIPNDGLILLRSIFHGNRLFVTNPRVLADLLVTNAYDFEKSGKIRNFLRNVLGDGLIIVEGDVHRFQRKHVMPAFSFRSVKGLYPMMWGKAVHLVENLTNEVKSQNFTKTIAGGKGTVEGTTEINSWANRITLDIIGVAGLGREFNSLKNSDDALVKDYEELLTPKPERLALFLISGFVSPALAKMLLWKVDKWFRGITGSLLNVCRQLVRDKREAIKVGGDEHFDILSLLIKSNDFSDDELVNQILTFLAAGHETTSSAFTWLTYLLATHPESQTRIRSEILSALPADPTSDPSIDLPSILESLPYLNAVCNETLRLYPTVPVTIRQAIRNTYLGPHSIPKGTEIFLSPWAINRSPDLWGPYADKFVPERWITNGKPNNHGGAESNYCLLTFLHGPRSCIGQGFAKAELRCLVAAFVRAFEWRLDMNAAEVVPAGVITIKPKKGLNLKLRVINE